MWSFCLKGCLQPPQHLSALRQELSGSLSAWLCHADYPGGLLGSIFAGYVPLASQTPYPIIVYFVANYGPHLSHFRGNVILGSQHSHFLFIKLRIYLINPFNYVIIKWTDTFVKMNTEHLLYSHFCTANHPIFFNTQTLHLPEYSYPQIPKICNPIIVNPVVKGDPIQRHIPISLLLGSIPPGTDGTQQGRNSCLWLPLLG